MMRSRLWLPALLALFAILSTASASVNPVGYYRLGENDPGATSGGLATNSFDSFGILPLTLSGSVSYSSAVVSNNFTSTLLSLNFPGNSLASNSVIANVTDNFGIEVWVKPSVVSGSRCLAYNGNTSANGWGLYQSNNNFCARFGGVAFFGSHPVVTNTWTHLALVRASGLATFYVNGVPMASITNAPIAPSGLLALGGTPLPAPAEFYDGQLDEVRVFTFEPERFSRNDLLFPPLDDRQLLLSRESDLVRLSWPASVTATFLGSTTNLHPATWTLMPRSYSNGMYHAVDSTSTPARFYQVSECETIITDDVMTHNGSPMFLSDLSTYETLIYEDRSMNNGNQLVLDFSQSLSSTVCSGLLTYEWEIFYEDPNVNSGEPYRVAGITGYDTPTLRILANSLLPTPGTPRVRFTLTISRPDNPSQAILTCTFRARISGTSLTLEQYHTCQNDPANCTNPNALPVP